MELVTTNGSKPMTQFFEVEIREQGEWHYATSKDLRGLFVAHTDYETVKRNIPECIEMILEHRSKDKYNVVYQPAVAPRPLGQKVYAATLAA